MMIFSKLRWYYYRISAMSGAELFHRAKEMYKRKRDRFRHYKLPLMAANVTLPIIPELRERLQQWQIPPVLLQEWREDGARTQAGDFFLLGQQWPAPTPTQKWHLDPVTGKIWPKDRFCFAINFRHARDWGDVKYVWELNRLQYLQPLAALAYIEKNEALAHWCLDEIDNWITQNPPYLGINWASGIELALRAVSIIIVTSLLADWIMPTQCQTINASLYMHGYWLARYPSANSSANNHRTAEGLGLQLIGALCPHVAQSARWAEHGWELLCETARVQILPDGIGAEQTPNYTAVVLEMLLLGLYVAQTHALPVPDYYLLQLTRAAEALRWFTDEAGNQPRIGDDDNARVIGAYRRDETYVRDILGCIAAITARADLSPPENKPHLRHLFFGFPPKPASAPHGVRTFADGGYTVGRHGTSDDTILLAIDHGYLGYLSIAAHGHADALAIWLHIGGQPVLVDAGTYLYHSGGDWRDYFRGTTAHNTLCLNGIDSSTRSGHFNWSHKANAQLTGYDFQQDHWWVEAEHDGYEKRFQVRHCRRLHVTPANGFEVEDSLIGAGVHTVSINFLLHPTLTAHTENNSIIVSNSERVFLRVSHKGNLESAVYLAGTKEGGWYSPTFSEKIPTTRIVFSGKMAAGQKHNIFFFFAAHA